jgi:hypothetical protein
LQPQRNDPESLTAGRELSYRVRQEGFMQRVILGVLCSVAIGCGGGDARPAPTCAQAMAHFYAAGCAYFDTNQQPPAPYSQSGAVNFCQGLVVAAPTQCQGEIDDWSECNAGVPSPASGNADCDCSTPYQALLRCR